MMTSKKSSFSSNVQYDEFQIRSLMKYFYLKGKTNMEIVTKITEVYGDDDAIKLRKVLQYWTARFVQEDYS